MALAVRIIPTVLCRGRKLVKGRQFNAWRSVGLAEQAVRIHQARGVDELCLLDIGATDEERGPDLALVDALTKNCFMPLAVGGGISTLEQAKALLRSGADKVVVGTAGPKAISHIAASIGSQAVIAAIDCHEGEVWVRSGSVKTRQSPVGWARSCAEHGAGEILLTSITREGTLEGYDLDLICCVSEAVDIPVIAHGGAGTYEHMHQAILAGANAVAAGAMFQFTDQTPRGAAEYLAAQGVETRR